VSEVEQQRVAGVVLHELTVEPGAQAQPGRIELGRREELGSERGVAVAAFGAHVRPVIGGPEVLQPQVVGCGHPAHVRPAVLRPDVARGPADHQRDLALEPEQLGPVGPFDAAAAGQ